MRLADLLVDLASVASASRSVASKHIALRTRQLNRYQKTSSVFVHSPKPQHQQQPAPSPPDQATPPPAEPSPIRDDEPIHAPPPQDSPSQAEVTPVSSHQPPPPGPTLPRTTVEPPPPPPTKPSFTPAPWANGIANLRRQTPRHPPMKRRSPIEIPLILGNEESEAGSGLKEQINLDVFRTGVGSAISEQVKEVPDVVKEDVPVEAAAEDGGAVVEETGRTDVGSAILEPVKEVPVVAAERVTGEAAKVDGVSVVVEELAGRTDAAAASSPATPTSLPTSPTSSPAAPAYELRESRVPSSRIGRLWNYGGLAAGMFAGAIGEGLNRAVGGGSSTGGSVMLSAANMERLVAKLSRMRGAALKLGQMMSFQDAKMLPAPIQEVLQRVQDRADYMPAWQRDRVLTANLGPSWRELFDEFEDKPIAAASIGQVHRATLKSSGARVAVKIQFPGVADSINSDLDNLSVLLAATKLLPKGLYLNKTIDNARTELGWECDYEREAACAARYRELLRGDGDEAVFVVPRIYPEASGRHVLTMEFMDGVGVTRVQSFSQDQRDWIGTQILRLCLREIVEFRFMQTDPNWTNFLYNAERDRLELLDFGASREYPDEFITRYVELLEASSRSDRARVKELSEELGYLTGHESKAMLEAHLVSVMTLAEPFLQAAPEVYDFRDQTITERVKAQIPVMIHERLAPPPEETYSLHRKLSGAFLLCAKLGSRVRCRELFEQALAKMKASKTQ